MDVETPSAPTGATETTDAPATDPTGTRPGGPREPIEPQTGTQDERGGAELDPEDVVALEGAGEAAPGEETVRIGDVDVPLSALSELPDAVLKKIKRKVKARGQELEVTLADALEAVPQAEGWRKRMWEAAQREKELEEIAHRMGTDHVGAYAALHGISRGEAMDRLGKQYLQELQRDAMTPEERAAADRQADLERKAARVEEIERKERERQMQAEADSLRRTFLAATKPALENSGLKASKRNIQQVASIVDRALRDGVIKGTPTSDDFAWAAGELAKEVAEERDEYLPADAEGEALIERIGVDRARKIAQAYAKRVRKAAPKVERQRTGNAPARQESRPQTWEEWRSETDRRQGIR